VETLIILLMALAGRLGFMSAESEAEASRSTARPGTQPAMR
jgi:hypothetical protein